MASAVKLSSITKPIEQPILVENREHGSFASFSNMLKVAAAIFFLRGTDAAPISQAVSLQGKICTVLPPFLESNNICSEMHAPFSSEVIEPFKKFGFLYKEFTELPEYTASAPGLQIQKLEMLNGKVQEYLLAAKSDAYPVPRAMHFHQAKDVLYEMSTTYSYEFEAKKSVSDMLASAKYQAAIACREAAELAENDRDKLLWLFRGIEELSLPVGLQSEYMITDSCSIDEMADIIKIGAALWKQAGEIFLSSNTYQLSDYLFFFHRSSEREPLSSEDAAAVCFRNAGFILNMVISDHDPAGLSGSFYKEESIELLDRAIDLQKNMNVSSWTLGDRAELQREIARVCAVRFHILERVNPNQAEIEQESVFEEFMHSQKLYHQLIESVQSREAIILAAEPQDQFFRIDKNFEENNVALFHIRRAIHLAAAASFVSSYDFNLRGQLYAEASIAAQAAWDLDRDFCCKLKEFQGCDTNSDIRNVYRGWAMHYQELCERTKPQEEISFSRRIADLLRNLSF